MPDSSQNNTAAIVAALGIVAIIVFAFFFKREPVGQPTIVNPNVNVSVNAPAVNTPVVPPVERDSNKGNVSEPNGK